jgi:hypothetical protein
MKIIIALMAISMSSMAWDIQDVADHYQTRFNNPDIFEHITDNTGEGFEDLYGTRNMRMVLKGILYRGGGNNYYHRTNRRSNINPLPQDGLENLCKEDFSSSVYLYYEKFETAPTSVSCKNRSGWNNRMSYYNHPPLLSLPNLKKIFSLVHEQITNFTGPIYVHCWNGWHASGYTAATALIQFCGMDKEEAVKYWDRNTDGRNTQPKYEKIRNRIRNFKPFKEFQISQDIQSKICPQ